jgi:hypothetical protein
MSLKVMEQLGLKTTRPYGNICGIDSKRVKVYGLCEDVEVFLIDFPHINLLMNIVVIDVLDAWGMLLSRSWSASLGGFLSMDLTHAHIPMGDGTFEVLYSQERVDKHVTDPNGPDYTSEDEFDEVPDTIEYDPQDFPFMQEDSIDMLLPRTNEYKEKLAKFQGKEPGSIQILKKEDKEREEAIKREVNANLLLIHTLRIYLTSITVKEVLRSCGTRRRESPSMTRRMTTHGLALTSSRRSSIKKNII